MDRRYHIATPMKRICAFLEISPARIVRRAGMSMSVLDKDGPGLSAADYFDLWAAVAVEADREDLPLLIGKGASLGPFAPPLLAFSCSPNVEIGLRRLALFKPMIAPFTLTLTSMPDGLHVCFTALDPNHLVPDGFGATEIVFILDYIRTFTGHAVAPLRVDMPDLSFATPAFRSFIASPAAQAPHSGILLSAEDAARPLISEDTEFANLLEQELMGRLKAQEAGEGVAAKVRQAVLETLPSGDVSVERISRRLTMSSRTLQRKLGQEKQNFQSILESTRTELAWAYLKRGDLSTEEISHLLAFRDPNSFYRAFQNWTGKTPSQARSELTG